MKKLTRSLLAIGIAVGALSSCGGEDDRVAELESQLEELTAQLETTTSLGPAESEKPSTEEELSAEVEQSMKDEDAGTIEVPRVVGMTESQAITTLEELSLSYTFEKFPRPGIPQGQVFSQSPMELSEVRPGTQIELWTSAPLTIDVTFAVMDGHYTDLGDGKCKWLDGGVYQGQSFRIIGPNGDVLASDSVGVGRLKPHGKSSTGESCFYYPAFYDLPEVATYTLLTKFEEFPAVSLSQLEANSWAWNWWWGNA